jgi:hypothetical protein
VRRVEGAAACANQGQAAGGKQLACRAVDVRPVLGVRRSAEHGRLTPIERFDFSSSQLRSLPNAAFFGKVCMESSHAFAPVIQERA